MKIIITKLALENFKCFRQKEIQFSNDITTISGRNGIGKTTIADAILWCLFGKNSQGQSDFNLKTHDENGKPIPNLDHSVELRLLCDDSIITLKRTLKETWVKKRGTDEQVFKNNTTEYLVNGDAYTAADYKKYISELISEETFRAITSPTYFCGLKWQQQREFLTKLVDMSDVAPTKEELDGALAEIPVNQTLIDYRKHLSYQIKGIKDKLEKIPVRLEEQNKALPERIDWDAKQAAYDFNTAQMKGVEEKIVAIKSGNGEDIRKNELRQQLDDVYTQMRNHKAAIEKRVSNASREIEEKIAEASRQFNSLLNTQKDLESQISSFVTLAKRCRETAQVTFLEEQAVIRKQWPETQKQFDVNGNAARCEMCGQILPPEQLEKAKLGWNQYRAEWKQKLIERAEAAKKLLADAEMEAKCYEEKHAEAEKNLADVKEQINTTFANKQRLEKEKAGLPTFETILMADEEYAEMERKVEFINRQLADVIVNSDEEKKQLADLEAKKKEYKEILFDLSMQIATRTQYDKGLALIDGIKEEEKDLVRQLSELERKEDVARGYQDRQNQILEARVNEHFSLVKWRMFRTVNNGGDPFDEPFCECYVDGVAYHDGLNQAARLNAGLDIINTLCKHFNVSAPIVLDNAESTINILNTEGQQIRLQVADTELQIV